MKKIKQIIFDFLVGIGKDPGPFIAGAVTTFLGFILGIAFMLSLK